jgi:hypothetical protein
MSAPIEEYRVYVVKNVSTMKAAALRTFLLMWLKLKHSLLEM